MLYNFIINSSNVVGNYNNQFRYKFPTMAFESQKEVKSVEYNYGGTGE